MFSKAAAQNFFINYLEFYDLRHITLPPQLTEIIDQFRDAIPDIEFMENEETSDAIISIYTNYNFKFEIETESPGDPLRTGQMTPRSKDGMYYLSMIPFEDPEEFFTKKEYIAPCEYALLYLASDGQVMAHNSEGKDIPFDVAEGANYTEGIWPCVFVANACSRDVSMRDADINRMFK
jgi:hypothetical protein